MKYAREVLELVAAFPGRDFRMNELVRYVMSQGNYQKHNVRIGVLRVLEALECSGSIIRRPPRASRGGYALYRWRT